MVPSLFYVKHFRYTFYSKDFFSCFFAFFLFYLVEEYEFTVKVDHWFDQREGFRSIYVIS